MRVHPGVASGPYRVDVLTRQVQWLPARRKKLDARGRRDDRGELGRDGDNLLEIIDDDQHRLFSEIRSQRLAGGCANADGLRDRRRNQRRIGDARKADEERAMRKRIGRFGRNLQGQPRLAASARTRQRQQASARFGERRRNGVHFALASDERSRLRGKTRRALACRSQRGEVGRQPRVQQLKQPLRLRQAFDVLAEIASGEFGAFGDERVCRMRKQDLSAMPRIADARRPVHADAYVVVGDRHRFGRVQSHPYAHGSRVAPRVVGQRDLCVEAARSACCALRKRRTSNRRRHRNRARVSGKRVAQQRAMLFEHSAVTFAPSSARCWVEPSMSVNRKVTVPVGRMDAIRTSACVRAGRRRKRRSVRHAAARIKAVPPAGTTAQRCYLPRLRRRTTPGDTDIERTRKFLDRLGPGLVTGAADDDPSGIATYSQAGAQFGLAPAVERVPDHAADGRHPGCQRADRPGNGRRYRAQPARHYPRPLCGSSCRCC